MYAIDDKASYPVILDICKEKKYGVNRQMLMGTLVKMRTPEAFEVLVDSLDDDTLRGHAIEGLGRFGDVKAIPILESLDVKKWLYESKAKNTAMRKLRVKLNQTPS